MGICITVFLIEHDMRMVMSISDRITVMDNGELLLKAHLPIYGKTTGRESLPGGDLKMLELNSITVCYGNQQL